MLTTPVVDEDGGGGASGVSPSSIAVAGPPPPLPSEAGDVRLEDVMRAVLNLQRDQSLAEQQDGEAGKVTGS